MPWPILSFLWNYKNQLGAFLLIVGVLAYVSALNIRIRSDEKQIESLNARVVELGQRNAQQLLDLTRLQEQLTVMVEAGKAKGRAAADYKKKYDSLVKTVQEKLGGLVSWNPNPSEGECDAAKRLLHDYRQPAR